MTCSRSSSLLFEGLEAYTLDNSSVQVTSEELGCGSYAIVLKLKYMGLKCAGKKIHSVLLMEEEQTYAAKHFREECELLNQVRHPNVVQFLGVFFPDKDEKIPIIVMEFLSMNLTDCIEKHSVIPFEISYSILHDVALGLHYLHSHSPEPIIHRDLSSNNVLLTTNMTAKISDLGVARIVNMSHEAARQLTKMPGTPAFMPPETMVENPIYDLSIDRFSYGVVMIHILSGIWPEPDTQPIRIVQERMEPVSEAERREKHIQKIGKDHPLMELILKCIHNDPNERPAMEEIIKDVSAMAAKFPASFSNEIDMLQHMEASEMQKSSVQSTKQERMLKVEEKLRELQSYQKNIEHRRKQQKVGLSKVQTEIGEYQSKNGKLNASISSLKNLAMKHKELLGSTRMLLQDTQQSITDFDQYISTEILQLHFTLTFSQSISESPFCTDTPSSITPPSTVREMAIKEEGDPTSLLSLTVTKEDNNKVDESSTVEQSDVTVEHVSHADLTKVSLEQLTLVEQIESDHVSIAWKGKIDVDSGMNVAVTELKSGTLSTADFLERATVMNKLSHSNVIELLGVCTRGPIYIITKMMGSSLLNYLQYETQVLQFSTTISMSTQVAEGMEYLHKQKCIHRNLSARNILIGENLICKIAGFELAKIVSDDKDAVEVDSNFKFPIRWTACETFTTYPHKSTFRSDVWSFGVLLWEIASFGCLPYPSMTNIQVQEEVIEGYCMPCSSRGLPALYTIMLKCWRNVPEDRPTFEDLLSEFKEVLKIGNASDDQLNKDDISVSAEPTEESPIYDCIVVHKGEDTTNFNHDVGCEMALITGNHFFERSQKQSIQLARKANCSIKHIKVYEGLWNKTTPVRVKVYSTHSTSALNFLQHIAKLNHPNIVKFYAGFQAKGALYTVTEFMKTDLLTYLQCTDQSLQPSQLVSISLEIVKGMIYIEDKKYTLRNLKASSIMLGENLAVCKICDLDLVQIAEDSLYTDPLTKVPIRWTAPEVLFHCKFSTKSDVWSFGILLWEFVTHGCTPYPKMTHFQVREQLFQGYRMPCPSECPEYLFSIMLECWNETPEERPTFTRLQEMLNHYLQEINELYYDIYVTRDEKIEKSEELRDEASKTLENSSKLQASLLPPSSPLEDTTRDDIYLTGDTHSSQDHGKNPIYEAILDYDSQDDNELSFKKDDLLEIQHTHTSWYWGSSRATGAKGYVPKSYISDIPVLSFTKKISKGTYNSIWAGIWNGKTSVTIKEESTTTCYTKDILELQHPNIVHIYAVYAESYIIMEPISQGKLSEVLQRESETFEFHQLITMSKQIAAGMAYLEEKNCIHRHLATRNVLVGNNFVCKISNFSAAKIVTRSCNFATYDVDNGTYIFEDREIARMAVKWAAPETMTRRTFSTKSDVWSYGVLLSEIVTRGSLPYPSMSNEMVLEVVLKGYRMPRPKGCPEKLYNIMLDCWKADFAQRPNFSSLHDRLETYFE